MLIPIEVDEWTGYRYYNTSQLRQMNQVIYLKGLGFSLDEILDIFDDGCQIPTVEMISSKIERCREDIKKLSRRLAELEKLEILLHKQENIMEKVFEKSLPSRIFATHRREVDSYEELFNLCPNVIGPEMQRLGCVCPEPHYCFTIEHQEEYGKDIDIEYFEAVTRSGEGSEVIKFKELPQVPVALCVNHYGPYEAMPQAFAELYAYAELNGYTPTELARFNYIDGIWNRESVDEWLTEIQLPVQK